MLYFVKKAEKKEDATLIAKKQDDSILLTTQINETNFDLEVSSNMVNSKPEIVHVGYSNHSGLYCFLSSEVRESRTGLAYALERNSGHCVGSMSCIASFWISDKTSEIVGAFNGHVTVWFEGFEENEVKVIETFYSSDKLFEEVIPESRAFIKRSKAKRKLIEQINELDSLSMLEAQLDLLTRFVLTGQGKEMLEKAVSGNMVSDLHDDDKLIKTISKQKKYLRNLQKKYFEDRGTYEQEKHSS